MKNPSWEPYLATCRDLIAKHGFMVQGVGGDATTPTWAYTVGLSLREQAELVMIGIPMEHATSLLNTLAKRLAVEAIPDHTDVHQVATMPLRLATLDPHVAWPLMTTGQRLGHAEPGLIRQVLWPDPAGAFPGDRAYNFRVMQSLTEIGGERKH